MVGLKVLKFLSNFTIASLRRHFTDTDTLQQKRLWNVCVNMQLRLHWL